MMFYKKSGWCGDHVHRLLSNTFYVAQLIEKQRINGGNCEKSRSKKDIYTTSVEDSVAKDTLN